MAIIHSDKLTDHKANIQDNVITPILMRYGRSLFIDFTDGAKARALLKKLTDLVANARQERRGDEAFTVNIGFTYAGLNTLGISSDTLASFPEAFRQGNAARAAVVGDLGPNAPEHWDGELGSRECHAMVYLRTRTAEGLEEATGILKREMDMGCATIRYAQDSMAIANEDGIGSAGLHLGFRDMIGQPPIEGVDDQGRPGDGEPTEDGGWRPIKPGEFILGFEDEAGEAPLHPSPDELRIDGSYLVYRKLYQDVATYRRHLAAAAKIVYGPDDEMADDKLAARMIGRWPSGCHLALSPDTDDPEIAHDPKRINNFTFKDDPDGTQCPLGAHARRSNPRLSDLKRLTAVRRHRLLRRSVEYGTLLPEGQTEDDGQDRGIIAAFVVADVERQFEFVQKEWIHSGEFIGLDPQEQDPINGVNGQGSVMTVPGAKVPFVFDLPSVTQTRIGAYLFVPGVSALHGIAEQRY